MWIHSDSISKPPSGSLQMLYMGGWIFSISMVHIHIPLSCKAVFYQMQSWNRVCMSTARTAKHLAENPFHILKGCHSLSVPWLCAQMPSPWFFATGWSAKGTALSQNVRMLVLCYPVGGTVTLCQGCACWFPPAVAERIVASATLYLSSLRSFRGWEKITVFADDNAIN